MLRRTLLNPEAPFPPLHKGLVRGRYRQVIPNRQRFSRRLRVAEDLADLVTAPPESFLRDLKDRLYLASGFLGLFTLWRLEPALRMNFDAIMAVSGISLEGPTKRVLVGGRTRKQRDTSRPDPQRWNRRKLRNLQKNLQRRNMLQWEEIRFRDPRLANDPNHVLRSVPADGLICWSGEDIYAHKKPSGHIGHVYGLAMPEASLNQRRVLQEILTSDVDPSVVDVCTKEAARVKAIITKQAERSNLGKTRLDFAKFDDIGLNHAELSFTCCVFASFSQSRGIAEKLEAILPVFDAND